MRVLTESEFNELIANLITPQNHSAYENNPFHRSLDHELIYFYYLDDLSDVNHPKPRMYIYDPPNPLRNRAEIRAAIRICAQNASDNGRNPRLRGYGFDLMKWTKRSLIVIVVDHDGWKFSDGNGVVFLPGNGKKPNHTFFDAFNYNLTITDANGQPKEVSAVSFENHMVDQYGEDLGIGIEEQFEYLLVDKSGPNFRAQPIDPGGMNLGPPVPPP